MSQSLYVAVLSLLCFQILTIEPSTWSSPNTTLPWPMKGFAVGEYNGTIVLIGGFDPQSTSIAIEFADDYTGNFGLWNLSFPIYGAGQFWLQNQENVYMIIDNTLSMFNMETKQHAIFTTALMPRSVGWKGCLAGTDKYMFVIGGNDGAAAPISSLLVFSLYANVWLKNVSSTILPHAAASCIVDHDHLWAIGGPPSMTTYERINITNITSNAWHIVSDLPYGAMGSRAVTVSGFISVIGGYNGSNYFDIVQIIDPNTGTASVAMDTLPYPVAYHGIVKVNDVIFAIGGLYTAGGDEVTVDRWMYKQLTSNPTSVPTTHPSTADPSEMPSKLPSEMPSNIPSTIPSNIPSTIPTDAPSKTSTDVPSDNPSIGRTIVPSQYPSKSPMKFGEASVEIRTTQVLPSESAEPIEGMRSNDRNILIPLVLSLSIVLLLVFGVYLCFRKRTMIQRQTMSNMAQDDVEKEECAGPGADTTDETAQTPMGGDDGHGKGITLQMTSPIEQDSVKKMNLKREGSHSNGGDLNEKSLEMYTPKGNIAEDEFIVESDEVRKTNEIDPTMNRKREGSHFDDDNVHGHIVANTRGKVLETIHDETTDGIKHVTKGNDERDTNEVQLDDNEFVVEGDADESIKGSSTLK
eukprot:536171_1